MNKKIVVFNIVYYAVIVALIVQGKRDPSSSLGYGFFILIFCVIAIIILGFLLLKKTIQAKTILDKIGIITATPILTILFFTIMSSFKEQRSSEWYFNKNNYRYKVITFEHDRVFGGRRIEYYRNADTLSTKSASLDETWVKDSAWIYLSKTGDTLKKVKYSNNVEVK